jgi:hypothetical protein
MSTATLTPTTEADFLRRQIADAEKKLAALNIEGQAERNKLAQQREFEASKRAVEDSRTRHANIQTLAIAHLADLKAGIVDAHLYRSITGFNNTVAREHVVPSNPQLDPEKKGTVDVLAQRLAQTLISEFQAAERFAYNEARFKELSATAFAAVAPKVDPVLTEIQEGIAPKHVEVEQPASVSTKTIVHDVLTTV